MIVHRFAATKPVKVIRTRNEVLPCAVAISANIYKCGAKWAWLEKSQWSKISRFYTSLKTSWRAIRWRNATRKPIKLTKLNWKGIFFYLQMVKKKAQQLRSNKHIMPSSKCMYLYISFKTVFNKSI